MGSAYGLRNRRVTKTPAKTTPHMIVGENVWIGNGFAALMNPGPADAPRRPSASRRCSGGQRLTGAAYDAVSSTGQHTQADHGNHFGVEVAEGVAPHFRQCKPVRPTAQG